LQKVYVLRLKGMREENNKRASNIPAGIVRNATVFLLLIGVRQQ